MSKNENLKIPAASVAFAMKDFGRVVETQAFEMGLGRLNPMAIASLDYVVICSAHIPTWVAKVKEILLSRMQKGCLTVRVSEVRSVASKWGCPDVATAFKPHSFDGHETQLTEFDDETFFTVGDPVQLHAGLHTHGALSIDRAIELLAETYRVRQSQIQITISAK